MQVTVRDAVVRDSATLAPLAKAALVATYSPIAQPAVYEAVIAQTCTESAFRRAIERASQVKGAHFLVAQRADGVVGFLDFAPDDHGLELRRLYVKVGATGGGVGSLLLGELEQRLPSGTGYRAIAHARNESGLRFWVRSGFVPSGEVDTRQHFADHRGLGFADDTEPEPSILLWRTIPSRPGC